MSTCLFSIFSPLIIFLTSSSTIFPLFVLGISKTEKIFFGICFGDNNSLIFDIILIKQNIPFSKSLKTALGMSFISMLSMEIAMNFTDYVLTGGAILNWWIVPIMLIVGFLTPWPYNYWRLKKHNQECH